MKMSNRLMTPFAIIDAIVTPTTGSILLLPEMKAVSM
jgi:hypothetical protein